MMLSKYAEDLIFSKEVNIRKKYSNSELKLFNYFYEKTGGYFPENIIVLNQFVFFFLNPQDYFFLSKYIHKIRKDFNSTKVLFIRNEEKLIKLLFSFFPDTYIHDIQIEWIESSDERRLSVEKILISILFLSYEDRGIAVGKKGSYIHTVNKLFSEYIFIKNAECPIRIKCSLDQIQMAI
ncbi:MAG: hypothetical protein BAJALOKI3v1_10050 [Promethearchaeota archaeon]|jgi:hypothetical protein|nr:MAG: hypothetical protein BAJALOKI3v1_10050 [Candidatus Lokiarchaeota archaeon]